MQTNATGVKVDRWIFLLAVTVVLNVASAVLFPILVTDASRWDTFAVSVIPVLWGLSLLFLYRTKRERVVCWVAVIGAIYWLLPTLGLPLQYWGK